MKKNSPALNNRQQNIVAIWALTVSGELEKLDGAINEGLNAGLRINEIKEILVQLYAYTGFPRSLNGLGTFIKILKRRANQGFSDEIWPIPSPFTTDKNSLLLGKENQTKLVGFPVKCPLFEFAPERQPGRSCPQSGSFRAKELVGQNLEGKRT